MEKCDTFINGEITNIDKNTTINISLLLYIKYKLNKISNCSFFQYLFTNLHETLNLV